MSDDLTIGTPGDVVVMTEPIREALHGIRTVAGHLDELHGRLAVLVVETDALPVGVLAPSVEQSIQAMRRAGTVIASAEHRARNIDRAVLDCLAAYDSAERVVEGVWGQLGRKLAWLAGFGSRLAAPAAVIAAGGAALTWLGASKLLGIRAGDVGSTAATFLEQHPRILSNPEVVRLIGDGVTNADAIGEGFEGIPEPLGDALGKLGLGVSGPAGSSAVLVALGSVFGLLKETAVTVERTTSVTLPASDDPESGRVKTLAERADHFIAADKQPHGEQVKIETISRAGEPDRYEVYVAGTVTFDPKPHDEPFDMTSNMVGVAQESPGAYRAVVDAMHQAGITSKSPVVLNGYSQGGLIASLVASSGDFNVKALVTFGAPNGQIPIASSIDTINVRHTEDLVPVLGGEQVNPHAVMVSRSVFDDRDPPTNVPLAGHDFDFYKETAGLIDRSHDPALASVLGRVDHFEDGATSITTSLYHAKRAAH